MCCARWRLDFTLSHSPDCSEKALEYCIKMAKESCCCSVAAWSTRQQSISVITARLSPECRFGVFGTHISRKSRNKKLHLRKSYSNTWPFIPSFINPAVELPNHRRRLGSTMLAETRFWRHRNQISGVFFNNASGLGALFLSELAQYEKLLYFEWSPPWHLYILISSGILSGISSGILSGKSSGILSGISCGSLSDILSGILCGIPSGILSGISSGILSGISSGILSGISSGILFGISHGILSGISSGILSGISSGILFSISHGILSGISSGILSDIYLAYLLAFYPPVEVQRCTLSWAGPRLRSSGAHWAGQIPGWGPAVHTGLGRSQVEVQRCTLSWDGPRGWGPAAHTELGSWQRAWRRELAKSLAKSWKGGEEKLEEEEEAAGKSSDKI